MHSQPIKIRVKITLFSVCACANLTITFQGLSAGSNDVARSSGFYEQVAKRRSKNRIFIGHGYITLIHMKISYYFILILNTGQTHE